jgi:diguanylate cyclase (GGDEF)-like protein
MKNKLKKSRPTIGLLIGRLEESYQARVWPGVTDFAQEHDINLIFYVGKSPKSPFDYDYQYNVMYDLVNPEIVDGLVLISGSLGHFLYPEELSLFAQRYGSIPLVSIAVEMPGMPSVLVDNRHGVKEMLRHLIDVHNYRKIAFVRGPKTHQEAEIRYNAYCEILAEYDMPQDPNLVVLGELSPQAGADAVRTLLEERNADFDAVMGANDGIALGIIREFQRRGCRIPQDFAVVGFDDINESSYITPPLTTVVQPLYEQAKTAMKILIEMIESGGVKDNVVLQTKLVLRESCGCYPKSFMDLEVQSFPQDSKAKTGEQGTESMKNSITEYLLQTLHVEESRKEKVVLWIDKLIDSLLSDLKARESSISFLNALKDILIVQQIDQSTFNFWQEVLTFLRIMFLSQFRSYQKLNRIEWLFQRAQDTVREFMMRALYSRNTIIEQGVFLLSEVSQRLITTFEITELMNVIAREVPRLGISSAYISLYVRKKIIFETNKWRIPPYSELVLGFDRDNRIMLESGKKRFKTKLLVPTDLLVKGNRWTLILMPLFFRDEQLGFILFELGPREEIIYETLRTQISSALKGASLFQSHIDTENELIKTLAELDHTNKELQSLSLRDELTGLYNRRAFLALGEQHLRLTRRTKKSFLLCFADLDKLKHINDTYGHREGDIAIIKTAEILKMTFRQADIIARFGGDEFTIIAIDATSEDMRVLKNNLQNNVDKYNQGVKKPYQIHISMGVALYEKSEDPTLERLISLADNDLYDQKRKRKIQ